MAGQPEATRLNIHKELAFQVEPWDTVVATTKRSLACWLDKRAPR